MKLSGRVLVNGKLVDIQERPDVSKGFVELKGIDRIEHDEELHYDSVKRWGVKRVRVAQEPLKKVLIRVVLALVKSRQPLLEDINRLKEAL